MDLRGDLQRLAIGRFLAGIGSPAMVDGEASGQVSVQGRAATIDGLDEAARVDAGIKVLHGNLRLDLVEAMRSKGVVRGGQLRFEDFAGSVAVEPERIRFGGLRLNSGFLRGSGQATVGRPSGALSGAVHLEMRSGADATQSNLSLDGSVDAPVLRAAR
jgi:hypothetical protein